MTTDIRIGIVGAGNMGADHIDRITRRIAGAQVSAVIDPDTERAARSATLAPGATTFARIEDALDAGAMDAVLIASPGRFHESALRPALGAKLPILCEKPLTPDSRSAAAILELEQQLDRPHIQVGFMRRFDAEYAALRELVASGDPGELLMLHCAHRNPTSPPGEYTQEMLINDSVVHEFDIVPWLAGSPIASVEVKYGRRNSLSPSHLREPILVLMELENGVLAEVEMNVNVRFGYQVATEAVFEQGIARIGQPSGIEQWRDGRAWRGEHASHVTRFAAAFDTEIQQWVDAVRDDRLVDGPTAWDGYRVALACEAGIQALNAGGIAPVPSTPRPEFYRR